MHTHVSVLPQTPLPSRLPHNFLSLVFTLIAILIDMRYYLTVFVIPCLFEYSHFNRWEVLIVVFICISLTLETLNIFSCTLRPFICLFWKKHLFRSSAHFLVGYCFCYWIVWILYIFCLLILYQVFSHSVSFLCSVDFFYSLIEL